MGKWIYVQRTVKVIYTQRKPSLQENCHVLALVPLLLHVACFLHIPRLSHMQTRHTFPYQMPATTALS